MNNSTSMKDMSYQAVMGRNNEIMKQDIHYKILKQFNHSMLLEILL